MDHSYVRSYHTYEMPFYYAMLNNCCSDTKKVSMNVLNVETKISCGFYCSAGMAALSLSLGKREREVVTRALEILSILVLQRIYTKRYR